MAIRERRVCERLATSFGVSGTAKPKGSLVPVMLTIPKGTAVLIQKQVLPLKSFTKYTTREDITVARATKDTPTALLIIHQGYKIWVGRSLVRIG